MAVLSSLSVSIAIYHALGVITIAFWFYINIVSYNTIDDAYCSYCVDCPHQ